MSEIPKNLREVYEAYRRVNRATDKEIAELIGVESEHVVRPMINQLLTLKFIEECENYFDEVEIKSYRQCRVRRAQRIMPPKIDTYTGLYNNWKRCVQCDLAASRKRIVFGCGNLNADVMVIGSGPGRHENEVSGLPYTGQAGQIARQKMMKHGFDVSPQGNTFVANLICCRYSMVVGNREVTAPPEKAALQACRPHLEQLLELIYPKMVILIGDEVADHFFFRPQKSFPVFIKGVSIYRTREFDCYHPDGADYQTHSQMGDVEWRVMKHTYEAALQENEPDIVWRLPLVV